MAAPTHTDYGVVTTELQHALVEALNPELVLSAEDELDERKSDWGMLHGVAVPELVVTPETVEQCVAVVKLCAAARVPIVPRGAGTGLEGGCVPHSGGVVVDMGKMLHYMLNETDMNVVVGPGWHKMALNKELNEKGLLFGPDPSSNPQVGGMASTSSSGMSTLKYGTTRENVLSMLVVTPQGQLLRTRQAVRKSTTGYELNQLYLGSEGTLGLIVELTLKVHPLPTKRVGSVMAFDALEMAVEFVVAVRNNEVDLSNLVRVECLNAHGVQATNRKFETDLAVLPTVFLELQGNRVETLLEQMAVLERLARVHKVRSVLQADHGEELDRLWEARRGCYQASMTYRGNVGEKVLVGDVCVPLSALPKCVVETEKDFEAAGFKCVMCCHIADGNFHVLPGFQPQEAAKLRACEVRMIERAISFGGSASGEHGVGVGKKAYLELEHGPEAMEVMRRIKRALDPQNIMNPGKVLDAASPRAAAAATASSASASSQASLAPALDEASRL